MYKNKPIHAKTIRAGVIPYYVSCDIIYMMFLKPADPIKGGDCFQISKGRVEENENFQKAAVREGGEELGLLESNIISIYEMGEYLTRMFMYAIKIENMGDFGVYEEETGAIRWMTIGEFMEEGRELHRPIVEDIHKRILEIEKI